MKKFRQYSSIISKDKTLFLAIEENLNNFDLKKCIACDANIYFNVDTPLEMCPICGCTKTNTLPMEKLFLEIISATNNARAGQRGTVECTRAARWKDYGALIEELYLQHNHSKIYNVTIIYEDGYFNKALAGIRREGDKVIIEHFSPDEKHSWVMTCFESKEHR